MTYIHYHQIKRAYDIEELSKKHATQKNNQKRTLSNFILLFFYAKKYDRTIKILLFYKKFHRFFFQYLSIENNSLNNRDITHLASHLTFIQKNSFFLNNNQRNILERTQYYRFFYYVPRRLQEVFLNSFIPFFLNSINNNDKGNK